MSDAIYPAAKNVLEWFQCISCVYSGHLKKKEDIMAIGQFGCKMNQIILKKS